MAHRLIHIAVLLWLLLPEALFSQQDSVRYQLRLGLEAGSFTDAGEMLNLTVTGVWYPPSLPFRVELMTGIGEMFVGSPNSTDVFILLRAGISTASKQGWGAYLAATMVKPYEGSVFLDRWYTHQTGGVLETSHVMDALCIEPGVTYDFPSIHIGAFLRKSLKNTISNAYSSGPFIEVGLGVSYIICL